MFRYCKDCDTWLASEQYTVDQSGETVCPQHKAVVGSLQAFDRGFPITEEEYRRQNSSWRRSNYDQFVEALEAAKSQRIVQ